MTEKYGSGSGHFCMLRSVDDVDGFGFGEENRLAVAQDRRKR